MFHFHDWSLFPLSLSLFWKKVSISIQSKPKLESRLVVTIQHTRYTFGHGGGMERNRNSMERNGKEKTIGEDDVLDEINSLGRRPRKGNGKEWAKKSMTDLIQPITKMRVSLSSFSYFTAQWWWLLRRKKEKEIDKKKEKE